MNTCGGCVKTWTGQNICHCATCHETFSCIAHFDTHRSPRGEHGACIDPRDRRFPRGHERDGEQRLRLNSHGVWVGNDKRPKFWEEDK